MIYDYNYANLNNNVLQTMFMVLLSAFFIAQWHLILFALYV